MIDYAVAAGWAGDDRPDVADPGAGRAGDVGSLIDYAVPAGWAGDDRLEEAEPGAGLAGDVG